MPRLAWWHLLIAVVASIAIAETLAGVAAILRPWLRIDYDLWFELAMVFGQIAVQWAVLWRRTWRVRVDYAAVLVFVSGVGAVLLWPLLLWNRAAPVTPLVGLLYFFGVVGAIFAVHVALVVRLGLPKILCVTWVLYRFLILLVVARFP